MRRLGKQGLQAIKQASDKANEMEQRQALERLKEFIAKRFKENNVEWENGRLVERRSTS